MTIGTVVLTLSPATPDVKLTGTIDAYGAVGLYNTVTYAAAVFGPAGTRFKLTNKGVIESDGTSAADAGILFGSPGIIDNKGGIRAGTGIDMFGSPGGTVTNTNIIESIFGDAIYLHGAGTVINRGLLSAAQAGIVLAGGGYADNNGTITASIGIVADSGQDVYTYNKGVITAVEDGLLLNVAGTAANAGEIVAGAYGIILDGGGIAYNAGIIRARAEGILTAGGTVINYASGTISGTPYGVFLSAAGTVTNAGSIAGSGGYEGELGGAVVLAAGGSVLNAKTGLLTGVSGIVAEGGPAVIVNDGKIEAAGNAKGTGAFDGIYAGDGGTVTNAGNIKSTSKRDASGYGILVAGAAGTVTNRGTVAGSFAAGGIVLRDGGTVINSGRIMTGGSSPLGIELINGGMIKNSGYVLGVYTQGQATITNTGTIIGYLSLGDGGLVINENQIGTVIFSSAGTLSNSGYTQYLDLRAGGRVINTGTITGYYCGINIAAGGYVLNHGLIQSVGTAVLAGPSGSIVNDGTITALTDKYNGEPKTGIISSGATIINNGLVYGYAGGIKMTHGGTVFQNGTIVSSHKHGVAVYFKAGYTNRLVVAPGASFAGAIEGGGGVLELASGAHAGALDLAGSVSGFSTIEIDPGAAWTLAAATFAASLPVENDGTLFAGPRATIAGAITGDGTIDLGAAILALDGSAAVGQHIAFTGTNEILAIGTVAGFAATVENFAAGDTIDLTGIAKNLVDNITFDNGMLTVNEAFSSYTITFANPSSFAGEKFSAFKDHGGTGITLKSTAKMAFLAPPPAAAPQASELVTNPAISPARKTSAAPLTTVAATGGWAPHLHEPASAMLPPITLQT